MDEIARMRAGQIPAVVGIHRTVLADDLLPALGERFLHRVYYGFLLDDPESAVLVASCGPEVAGVVVVSFNPAAHFSRPFRHHPLATLAGLLRLLLLSPRALCEAVVASRRRLPVAADCAEIAVLAVAPEFQKRGLGRRLVAAANRLIAERGCAGAITKTLRSKKYVQDFYRKNWQAAVVAEVRAGSRDYVYLRWRPGVSAGIPENS